MFEHIRLKIKSAGKVDIENTKEKQEDFITKYI